MPATNSEEPVLIVEDDKKTSSLLSIYLKKEGFETVLAYDGRQALELARRHNPIFMILDLLLPQVDGWEVCRELRHLSDVPILILTARGGIQERIKGLTLGADDYVVKPFSPEELIARVKAILRRTRLDPLKAKELLSYKGLVVNPKTHKVTIHGDVITLTPSEYKLLHILMANPGRVFLRKELLDHLYPTGEVVIGRVIDVHIGNLRQKIEEASSKPQYLLTARGLGYQFTEGDGQLQEEARYE